MVMIETSYSPKVSLDPKVHYTTQQGKFDRLQIGVGRHLTDSRIEFYALNGVYGTKQMELAKARVKARKNLHEQKRLRTNRSLIYSILEELL